MLTGPDRIGESAHLASPRVPVAFLTRYAGTDTLVGPVPFPAPAGGRVDRDGDAGRFMFERDAG